MAGKPRSGPQHWLMKRTRAQFKLALRYCKQHEDTVRSNMYATALINKDYNNFGVILGKSSNDLSTLHATSVGGCNGDSAITEMWQLHFKQLYNCINDNDVRDSVLQRITDGLGVGTNASISVQAVSEACTKQQCGKDIGLDGIAMEAYITVCTVVQNCCKGDQPCQ